MPGNLRNENNSIIRRFTSTGTADGTFENRVLEIVKEKWTSFLGSIKPLAGGAVLGIGEAAVNRGISVERGLILKFTPNGTLDGQFGRGGYQFLAPPTDDYSVNVHDSYVQPDGKIVVLATGRESGDTALMLWRVTSTGALDNTFGTNGFTSVAEANTDLYPSSLVAGTDGKLMVPLQKFVNSGGNTWIYQFTSNGTLDSSFTDGQNVPGAKQPSIGDGSGNTFPAYSFPADNGKFFVSGSTSINSSSHAYLAKFLPTGILDTSFSGGYVTWDSQQTNQMNYISHVARDNSGKVYVFGSTTNPSEKPLLVQLNADGSRNNSFNGTGFAALDFRDPTQIDYSYVVDVVLNDDVFTVIGSGDSDRAPYSSRSFSGVGRISTSGVLDANFGTNGFIDPFPTSESYFSDIALLSNGVSLIAGMVTVGKESKMALMRIGPTGSAPTTAPPTTAPPTTAPPTTAPPTTTTVPTVITETSDEIKLVISVSQAAVLKRMKLTVPSGSKVTMRSTSAKVCRVVKTRVIASATGTCRISVTITDKKKKKTTKSTSFRVS